MNNKEKYQSFCGKTYVPIYSKPWWLDCVCGAENWDVWLYESGGNILAAMPYFLQRRGEYRYITKAPLTQNNGIIFLEDKSRKPVKEAELQEKIINAACDAIEDMHLDVYEQQFTPSFCNWTPFFWRHYTNFLRYTYIIPDTSDLEAVWGNFSPEYRNEIKKGQRLTSVFEDISKEEFYDEHEKVFLKQGAECPFSREFWNRLVDACHENGTGKMLCARDADGVVHAVLFLVWDERSVYHLLGGYMPDYSRSQAYPALTYRGITIAHELGLAYDFEGSMIKQIAKSFRQYGGIPTPYYRIRKVFNPEIVRAEAEQYIRDFEKSAE